MSGKPKVSPNDTYILDQEDVDELDELSFTTVLGDATGSLEEPPLDVAGSSASSEPPATAQQNQEINELIDAITDESSAEQPKPTSSCEDTVERDAPEELQDLLAPEAIFPDIIDDEGDAS